MYSHINRQNIPVKKLMITAFKILPLNQVINK